MLEKLAELREKSKGTLFEEMVEMQIEQYEQAISKKQKRAQINNTWIEQADALFNLYIKICEKMVVQFAPFMAQVDYEDQRETSGEVRLVVTNYKNDVSVLHCGDIHSLADYDRLSDEEYLATMEEEEAEGGVRFYFEPSEALAEVMYREIFQHEDPIWHLEKKITPFLQRLFETSFDLVSLLEHSASDTTGTESLNHDEERARSV